MKKWAHVLFLIGIIWIILILIGLTILYFNLDNLVEKAGQGAEFNPTIANLLSTINLNSPINSMF